MDWLTIIYSLLSGLGSSFITFVFLRRKNSADAQSTELDNVDKAVSIWRKLAEDLRKEIDVLKTRMMDIEESMTKKCDLCKYRKAYYKSKDGQ